MLAILALILCAMPWLCFMLWRTGFGKIPLLELAVLMGALSGGGAVLCAVGVFVGHVAWRRAAGQRVARVASVLSLMVGYFSTLATAMVVYWLVTGQILLYKKYVEPPDFTASDESEFDPPNFPPDLVPPKMPSKIPSSTPQRPPPQPAER